MGRTCLDAASLSQPCILALLQLQHLQYPGWSGHAADSHNSDSTIPHLHNSDSPIPRPTAVSRRHFPFVDCNATFLDGVDATESALLALDAAVVTDSPAPATPLPGDAAAADATAFPGDAAARDEE